MFVLRVDTMDIPVDRSRLIIGRSSTADVQFDGSAVSRQHAAITIREHGLVLEDLGSRNGVFVNGVLIRQPFPLEHGDRVRIGDNHIEIVLKGRPETPAVELEDISLEEDQDVSTARVDPLEVLGGIIDRALDDGNGEEAEALVAGHLRVLLREAEDGRPLPAGSLSAATRYALRLAETTGKGLWVDYVFDLHLFARRLLATTTIRELFRLAPVTRYQERPKLRRYIEFVASHGMSIGSEAPAVLERLTRYGRL